MVKETKIALIIPYIGSWPSYFNLFLKGCEPNQWLDVLFFTDCPVPEQHPKNVFFYPSSLRHISMLASEKLGDTVSLSSGYKLCDLRPFFGLVFANYLKEYTYWGYGDIDLIYGDLQPFVISRIAAGYDVLSSRFELLSGSFSLFRNAEKVNQLCKRIPDFINLLQSHKHECLDETGHCNIVWRGGTKLDLPEICFTNVVAKADDAQEIKASFETICKEHIDANETIDYSKPVIRFANKSIGYYHYVVNKNKPGFTFPNWENVPDQFYITDTGFYTANEYRHRKVIGSYRKISGHFSSINRRIFKKVLRTIGHNA